MTRCNALLTLLTVLAAIIAPASALTAQEIADIFSTYDVDEEEIPDCQDEDMDAHLCPSDENIPCAEIPKIVEHCKAVLGDEISARALTESKGEGKNALEGCVKYVGFHVFDEDHMACCPSDVCEEWIDLQFEQLATFDDDDEEDFEYDDDDDDDFGDEI